MHEPRRQYWRLLHYFAALLALVSMVGCSSLRVVEKAAEPGGVVVAGDEVIVSMKTGARFALRVQHSTSDVLVGERNAEVVTIGWSNIERLERREVDVLRTALAIVAIVGVLQVLRGLAKVPGKTLGATP